MIILPIHCDVIKYVISDYIICDNFNYYRKLIKYVTFHKRRIRVKKYITDYDQNKHPEHLENHKNIFVKETLIDGIPRKRNFVSKNINIYMCYNSAGDVDGPMKIFIKGILRRGYSYKDGKLHGVTCEWNSKGILTHKVNYFHGILHGKEYIFRNDSSLNSEETYCSGIPVGWTFYWNNNGSLKYGKMYRNGRSYLMLSNGNIIQGDYYENQEVVFDVYEENGNNCTIM